MKAIKELSVKECSTVAGGGCECHCKVSYAGDDNLTNTMPQFPYDQNLGEVENKKACIELCNSYPKITKGWSIGINKEVELPITTSFSKCYLLAE